VILEIDRLAKAKCRFRKATNIPRWFGKSNQTEMESEEPPTKDARKKNPRPRTRMDPHEPPRLRQAKSTATDQILRAIVRRVTFEDRPPNEIFGNPIPLGQNTSAHFVIEPKMSTKAFRRTKVLMKDNMSFRLPPGGMRRHHRPQRCGKTTLFKMLTGQEPRRPPA